MSRKEREELEAMLAADPALSEAWDSFRSNLERASFTLTASQEREVEDIRRDLEELCKRSRHVRSIAVKNYTRH